MNRTLKILRGPWGCPLGLLVLVAGCCASASWFVREVSGIPQRQHLTEVREKVTNVEVLLPRGSHHNLGLALPPSSLGKPLCGVLRVFQENRLVYEKRFGGVGDLTESTWLHSKNAHAYLLTFRDKTPFVSESRLRVSLTLQDAPPTSVSLWLFWLTSRR